MQDEEERAAREERARDDERAAAQRLSGSHRPAPPITVRVPDRDEAANAARELDLQVGAACPWRARPCNARARTLIHAPTLTLTHARARTRARAQTRSHGETKGSL
jgi:hypothetical protein